MINSNILFNFCVWYVSEKEKNLSKEMKSALNLMYFLLHKKKQGLTKSLHVSSNKYKVDIEELLTNYRKRRSYFSAAKKIYSSSKFSFLDVNEKIFRLSKESKLCECGCGEYTKKGNRFIIGHNIRLRSKDKNINQAELMRKKKEENYYIHDSTNFSILLN